MNKIDLKPGLLMTIIFVSITCFLADPGFSQQKGTFTDNRDNHNYRWMMFGKQAWMLGNLDYKTSAGSWVYNNDSTKEAAFGLLYNYSAGQKACPKGWHMPTDKDWNALIAVLGGDDVAGGKFQEADSIPAAIRAAKGADKDNFTALFAGVRHADSTFSGIGLWGGFWSATNKDDMANNFLFTRHGKPIGKSSSSKSSAFSVKCVRNK